MAIELKMPALSPTMEEGKLARWLVKEGDEVHSGDIIAEIETDKATMEFESIDEGTIGKILIAEGTEGGPGTNSCPPARARRASAGGHQHQNLHRARSATRCHGRGNAPR